MKILWINAGLLPDACEAMGYSISVTSGWMNAQLQALRSFSNRNHQFYVLSFDWRHCDIQMDNVHYRTFGRIRGVTYGAKVPADVERAAKEAISEFKPDIIHIHGTEYFYGRMSPEVYCGCPCVLSLQGILTPISDNLTGAIPPWRLLAHQFNLKRFRYNSTIYNDQKRWMRERVPQEHLVFRSQKYFMGRTSWDQAWTMALRPDARYFHVNETLRSPFYTKTIRDVSKMVRHTIYCSAAAGYSLKGAHVLFAAVAYLKRKYPDIQVRVCAAEKLNARRSLATILHDDQYGSYLRQLMDELGIRRNVVGLPALSAEEVAMELARAEVFVLPSFCENSPNSLGEAQLIGTPAISTYAGGTPSILKNGVEGRLVQPGDPAALAAVIDEYFAHPEQVRRYAAAAREAALVRHDPGRNAARTLEVYREVIRMHAEEL